MHPTVKFIIGIIIGVVAYALVRTVAPMLGAGQLLSSLAGGIAAALAFFAAGKSLGYLRFKVPNKD